MPLGRRQPAMPRFSGLLALLVGFAVANLVVTGVDAPAAAAGSTLTSGSAPSADVRIEQGFAYWLLGSPDLARRSWQTALTTDPGNTEATLAMALAQAAQGQLDQAAATLVPVVQRQEAELGWVKAWQGDFWRLDGDLVSARRAYEEAIAASRVTPPLRAVFGLALIDEAQGRYPQAQEGLRWLVGMNPTWVEGYLELAHCQQALGDLEGAMTTLRQGLQLAPFAASLRWSLAELLSAQGDAPAAQAEREWALRLDPTLGTGSDTGSTPVPGAGSR